MSMREFIKKNRVALDQAIQTACPNGPRLSDHERERWILNDEGLYRWARSEGVRI